MSMASAPWEPQPVGRAALLWGGAALVAALAHSGVAWLALHRAPAPGEPASPPPAVMIELAPEAVAPPSDRMEVAPNLFEQQEVVAPDTLDTPDAPAMVEDTPTPQPDVTPPPDLAPLPPTVSPDVVLPPLKRQEQKPPPVKADKKAEKAKPPVPKELQQQAKSDTAAPSEKIAAPKSGEGASGAAVASWSSKLTAHLKRKKRYPVAAQSRREEGVAQVRFTVDEFGKHPVLEAGALLGLCRPRRRGDGADDARLPGPRAAAGREPHHHRADQLQPEMSAPAPGAARGAVTGAWRSR
ncbi:MAG: hypothetical protein QM699_03665 [Amaricoccus sp.]